MNLSTLRRNKNLKMTDLASRLGISQGHLSNLENGHRKASEDLIEQVALILGEPLDVVTDAARRSLAEPTRLNSWLSNVRINGLPLSRAFWYYAECKGITERVLYDDALMRKELKCFIESNISYSVVAELTENRNVIPTLRMQIAKRDIGMKEQQHHEQCTGNE